MNKTHITLLGIAAASIIGFGAHVAKDEVTDKKTDIEWAEENKAMDLHLKFDYELQEMKIMHENKLRRLEEAKNKAEQTPEVIRVKYIEMGMIEPEVTTETQAEIERIIQDYNTMYSAVEHINKEIELRHKKKINRSDEILTTRPSTERAKSEYEKLK